MPNTPEDNYTNTVDGAASYEKYRALDDNLKHPDDDWSEWDVDYHGGEDDEDYCGCSDIECPCDGLKRYGRSLR